MMKYSKRSLTRNCPLFISLLLGLSSGSLLAQDPSCIEDMDCESSWTSLSSEDRERVFAFGEDYKDFIHRARTELSFVSEAIIYAEAQGFEPLTQDSRLRPGDRVYEVNRDRTISLMVIGSEPMENGFHVVGAHIDSPRLELKGRPFYNDGEFAMAQTTYHGGIKFHQWTNLPLAMLGRIDKKDGTTIDVNVGLEADDPIFMVPELSPHVDRGRASRRLADHVEPEDLDPVVGHLPSAESDDVSGQVMAWLSAEYNIDRADLVSAELSLVPAGAPRDLGFDRALIAAYGQDDRLAAYTSLRALAQVERPEKTAMVFLVDNEEVGNRNNTGAASDHFADLLSRMIYAQMGSDYREPVLRKAMRNTRFVSIDVNPGVNPIDPGAWELGNAPRLGYGVNLKLYGQGNNANSEFIAWIRALLDDNQVPWQTVTYKVGGGGGGTIGGIFSSQNIEVIDFGVPLLSIHTPYAVSSKIDVYSLYRAAEAFYNFTE